MPHPETLFGRDSSILITGASSGIGAELAEYLASYGGQIALCARREDRLAEVADKVRQVGGKPMVLALDVTDEEAVKEASRKVAREQGPISVAFLNAGSGDSISLKHFDARRITRLFEINIFGVLYWLEAILPSMIKRGTGTIAATSSLAAARGFPGGAAYSATKAGLSSLFDGYRSEAAFHGVKLLVIEPGFIKSEMTAKNKIPMPFLMESRQAVQLIAEGVVHGKPFIRFPWQMSAVVRLLTHLPTPFYDRLGTSILKRLKASQKHA